MSSVEHVRRGHVDVGDGLGGHDDPARRRRRAPATAASISSRNASALAKNSGASQRKRTSPSTWRASG